MKYKIKFEGLKAEMSFTRSAVEPSKNEGSLSFELTSMEVEGEMEESEFSSYCEVVTKFVTEAVKTEHNASLARMMR